MDTELHVNGALVLELRHSTEIETMIMNAMAKGAAAGKTVTLSGKEDGRLFVSVEK